MDTTARPPVVDRWATSQDIAAAYGAPVPSPADPS